MSGPKWVSVRALETPKNALCTSGLQLTSILEYSRTALVNDCKEIGVHSRVRVPGCLVRLLTFDGGCCNEATESAVDVPWDD